MTKDCGRWAVRQPRSHYDYQISSRQRLRVPSVGMVRINHTFVTVESCHQLGKRNSCSQSSAANKSKTIRHSMGAAATATAKGGRECRNGHGRFGASSHINEMIGIRDWLPVHVDLRSQASRYCTVGPTSAGMKTRSKISLCYKTRKQNVQEHRSLQKGLSVARRHRDSTETKRWERTNLSRSVRTQQTSKPKYERWREEDKDRVPDCQPPAQNKERTHECRVEFPGASQSKRAIDPGGVRAKISNTLSTSENNIAEFPY